MPHHAVRHLTLDIDGMNIFYRDAGPTDGPVVLLPHGYPCSSYEFRNYMAELADHWRLIAPDFPGCGYSDTPADFDYTFDGYADFLERFVEELGLTKFALYLHDFGSQIGLRLAIKRPELIASLIIQNGDIYEDALGPKYKTLREYWKNPTKDGYDSIRQSITKEEFGNEFLNDVGPDLAELITPDLWELHWSLMTERRKDIAAALIASLKDNLSWFPRYQAYLREYQPKTLIIWGPRDGYMPKASAQAYLRDLPDAELHLLDGGHWLLETNLEEAVAISRKFLRRTHSNI
ncbi:alpha/beta hydrolase [Phyllobacterium sp. YR531]|uniref:alpha/beta fold hydrolase n=1 Tax=Phyllobacterium sp. YR531 TaxID=1144343 RepID=UPI00026F7E7A|nr:alpha/beta hydrolase [Phyllobacterium sp. YR531]EJN02099.1 putative hydrolase or acyltransferase of alpha/beta superfamily [Phyllobacterium sp. YR531]